MNSTKTIINMPKFKKYLKYIGLGLLVLPLILAVLGFTYQTTATVIDQRHFPPPGQLVDVGGYKMHVYCMGAGTPTVILDSANVDTVSTWAWIQPEIAKGTRVCAYDRADSGWSDLSPEPNDTQQNAKALHALLEKANVSAPYILVGHSFGGLFVRTYAEMYPEDVVGMVLIEGILPDGLKALGKPDVMPNTPDAGMMDATPVIGRLGVLRLLGFPAADPDLPEPQRSETQAYLASNKWADSIKRQYHLFPDMLAHVRSLYSAGSLGDMPLAVVLGSEGDGGVAEWRELFSQQAAISTNNVLVVVEGANHLSLVHRREYALQTSSTILNVLDAARSATSLR